MFKEKNAVRNYENSKTTKVAGMKGDNQNEKRWGKRLLDKYSRKFASLL